RFASLSLPIVLVAAAFARAGDEKKLAYETPKDWKAIEGKGGMMAPKGQWELAKAEGDNEAPTVKLYNFGGQGGTIDDNVKRWASQFKTADGEKIDPDKLKRENFAQDGIKVTYVEITGTYSPPAMMGGGDPKKGQKLIGAYVEGEGGPWFVKLQGPEKSVDKNKDAYIAWLKTWKL